MSECLQLAFSLSSAWLSWHGISFPNVHGARSSCSRLALPFFFLTGRQSNRSRIEIGRLNTRACAYATINGEHVAIHNIRNFDYRSETDFTPRYYDKTFDLNKLDSVDIIASYWVGEAIAHIIVSFGFAGTDFLAVSIETRRERNESYSPIAGFFKQYELFYVVADERDLLRLRTNYRKDPPEDVYLYRIRPGPSANRRRFFLDYVREINSLAQKPEFYSTLTTNCTTSVLTHSRVNPGDAARHGDGLGAWSLVIRSQDRAAVKNQVSLVCRVAGRSRSAARCRC